MGFLNNPIFKKTQQAVDNAIAGVNAKVAQAAQAAQAGTTTLPTPKPYTPPWGMTNAQVQVSNNHLRNNYSGTGMCLNISNITPTVDGKSNGTPYMGQCTDNTPKFLISDNSNGSLVKTVDNVHLCAMFDPSSASGATPIISLNGTCEENRLISVKYDTTDNVTRLRVGGGMCIDIENSDKTKLMVSECTLQNFSGQMWDVS